MRALVLGGALALATTAASAATIDFEGLAAFTSDPTVIDGTTGLTVGDVTFTSTEDMQLVGVGNTPNVSGFVPNDDPGTISGTTTPADFGDVFLTGDFIDNTDMTLTFGTVLSSIQFQIVDIDGSGANNTESFTFTALDSLNGIVDSVTITGAGAPDAQVDVITFFGADIKSLTIVGTTVGGTRNIGWGIDNIITEVDPFVSEVPLPAAGLLLLGALGGMSAMRSRKRST